ncbi:MAG: flagellar hook-basal body protein [Lysobacteraceae bacterium]
MTDPVQTLSRSLGADVRMLSSVSQNVANMHTPGYRAVRAAPVFRPDMAAEHTASAVSTAFDQRDGVLAQTARPLDVALRGPGFFVIERDGRALLARSGAFRTDDDGRLVTAAGDAVMGYSGELRLPAGEVRIGRDGQVSVGATAVGQLQIVAVGEPARLHPAGDGAYAYDGALAEWRGTVVQGALERGNVDAADETVRLMELTRHAESIQRAISAYDNAIETGINQIGGN